MDDLNSRARALVRGPCILGEPWRLILRYLDGELWDDPEAQYLLSRGLQNAQAEAARLDDTTPGPARDARCFYQRAAELLMEIRAEVSARQQQDGG